MQPSESRTPAEVHQGNVTLVADGEVDRSPCGSVDPHDPQAPGSVLR